MENNQTPKGQEITEKCLPSAGAPGPYRYGVPGAGKSTLSTFVMINQGGRRGSRSTEEANACTASTEIVVSWE